MDARQLYEMLRKVQEPKGYYFNEDMDMTMPLLESLLTNKERLGYMACPCRLANGEFEADKDIVCPCTYREDDVKEYGACFCALYVSKEYNDGTIEKQVVPERRPPEKILF
ncbi:ferredoxin-thioredoxin reductase catalytic domain-containing protein [Pseudodesulfovibrio indicus]|uniref:ferredoxin:thioredoxin reductase n=2 Tax=Pseudodesulfovibrio indicus TaxID=1716143 RepID=A0AA94PSB2_9BACT|nr:ferredoxin-thioredoxin reductase catalytic domain-containing protein [Pseudodesulfovibrio indicus]TDT87175.1 ferredoxin-thioredoxin reductase catalytic subunit [Pseudodesulfovibrio indicus]